MNTIRWIIAAAASVLVGLTLTAWLQEPIENYFRNDRIEANLTVGPWVDLPNGTKGDKKDQIKPVSDDRDVAAIRPTSDLDDDFRTKPSNFSEISVENKSEKEITNIRIIFDSKQYRVAFVKNGEEKSTTIDDIDRLELPDMKPGDRIIVRAWGNYYVGLERFVESLSTYSSTGPFRIKANWSETRDIDESAIDNFMDEWGYFLFAGSLMVLTAIGFILSSLVDEKIKKILSNENTYLAEKKRYELNPEKYNALEESKPDPPASSPGGQA